MICPLLSYSTPWIVDLSTPDVRSYKEQFDSLPQSNSALTIYEVYNKTRRFSYLACVSCHTDVVSKCHPLSGGGHVYTVVCHMTGVDGASRPLPLPLPAVSTVSRAEHSGWLTGQCCLSPVQWHEVAVKRIQTPLDCPHIGQPGETSRVFGSMHCPY